MPRIHTRPNINKLYKYLSQELWEICFPYSKVSAVFTHDNEPFWRLKDFIEAVEWLNQHQNPDYHNFGTDSNDDLTNLLEIASFLANFNQETGWDLEVPYPYGWPKQSPMGDISEGNAGGALAILEGASGEPYFGESSPVQAELKSAPLKLTPTEKRVLRVPDSTIGGIVRSLAQLNQPQFGLGLGSGNGAVFLPKLVSVSDDGTLWGDDPINEIVGKVNSTKDYKYDLSDRRYSAMGPYAQYGGRGAVQLSYNYNYSECSIALFNDYRLVRFPNLIITTDRETFNGKPFYFGFPGPNPNGNNQLPQDIKTTTPNARVLAWLTSLWFWMDKSRSGRKMSCHQCMLEPFKYGITGCNLIINNDSGCSPGWAGKKVSYYKRISRILLIPSELVEKSIVCPPNSENLRR